MTWHDMTQKHFMRSSNKLYDGLPPVSLFYAMHGRELPTINPILSKKDVGLPVVSPCCVGHATR